MNTAVRRRLPHHMTVDEFIAWVGDGRWQLVDGEPRAMAPANATHGIIQAQARLILLTRHLRDAGSPCRRRDRTRNQFRAFAPAATCGCLISLSPVHRSMQDSLRCLIRC